MKVMDGIQQRKKVTLMAEDATMHEQLREFSDQFLAVTIGCANVGTFSLNYEI